MINVGKYLAWQLILIRYFGGIDNYLAIQKAKHQIIERSINESIIKYWYG